MSVLHSVAVEGPGLHGGVPLLTSAEAIAIARDLGRRFAEGDAGRDRDRALPYDEISELQAAGLLAITVPAAYGGPDLPFSTVAEVIRLISWGDPNIGQIPHSHFVFLNQLRLNGQPPQQGVIYPDILDGTLVANAQSEFGTKTARDFRTTLLPDGPHRWRLSGEKFYCTGSLFAGRLAVLAHLDEDGPLAVAWVRPDLPGVDVVDDWDALGQRTTGSGTVRFDDVPVTAEWITPFSVTFDGPSTYGAVAQLLHTAIDVGIARRALDEASEFVRTRTRPYADAGVDRAAEDPVVVHAFGELELAVRGAEALLAEAGRAVDRANADLTDENAIEASLAVAAARASAAAVSVEAGSRFYELAGTRAVLADSGHDRHWRNARTHSVHDPAGWKVQHLGRWAVDRVPPPRHGQI